MAMMFEGAIKDWKFVLGFLVLSVIFWVAELAYQVYFGAVLSFDMAIVRSFSFSAATFISLSLLSSIVFKFYPKYAKYHYVRRSLGVMGVVFGFLHVYSVLNAYFFWDLSMVYSTLDPIQNPLVFGTIALSILFLLFITSTDWAEKKLTPPKWKMVHRLVYFGYWALVAHFLLTNPPALMNLAGYLLIFLALATLAGELYWFIKMSSMRKFSNLGSKIGFLIIFMYLVLAYFVYVKYFV